MSALFDIFTKHILLLNCPLSLDFLVARGKAWQRLDIGECLAREFVARRESIESLVVFRAGRPGDALLALPVPCLVIS